MTADKFLSELVRAGLVAELDAGDFLFTASALAPWARKALADLNYGPDSAYDPLVRVRTSFHHHKDKWLRETTHLSGGAENHSSYKAIISLGRDVLPYLLAELELNPNWWFAALAEISGEDPVKPHQYGNLASMRSTWIQWGRIHGYLP